jgi:oxygen-independent coproporphyrinogen-3 oxidase
MAGIYIHVPFCKQACSYCDFYFVTRQQLIPDYVERLIGEIRSYANTHWADRNYQTLYLGGGTPSLLSGQQLQQIVAELEHVFNLELQEFTVELNPDDVTKTYVENLRAVGVDRLSMGIQSFHPQLLQFMHRAHTADQALQSLEILSESPIQRYTVDLIYGNPGQTLEMLNADLNRLLAFDPPHISAYSLTIEPQTRLGKMNELGRLRPAPEQHVAEQQRLIRERLAERGIRQYEVSNYSRPGREAVHNSQYWRHQPYLGLGPGAHSLDTQESGEQLASAVRIAHAADIRSYLNSDGPAPIEERESLNQHNLAEERIMLALRTRRGISEGELSSRYHYTWSAAQYQWMEYQKDQGYVEGLDPLRLTPKGLVIADTLTLDLLTIND